MTILVGVQVPTWSRAAIQAAAREASFRGAEMLVLGSRGDGAMSRLMASQYVLRNAPCPVLVVPDPVPSG